MPLGYGFGRPLLEISSSRSSARARTTTGTGSHGPASSAAVSASTPPGAGTPRAPAGPESTDRRASTDRVGDTDVAGVAGDKRGVPLTENDVVDAVCRHLDEAGWTIEQSLRTTEHGADIVARRSDETVLRVEAKGATSSKTDSARYGRPFSRAQIASHIARAFYTAAATLESGTGSGDVRSAIALPATPQHREFVDRISGALEKLGIGVFWVDAPDRVRLEAAWRLETGHVIARPATGSRRP